MGYVRINSGFGDYASTQAFINPFGLPENCNTAGHYAFHQPSCWLIGQCMTVEELAAAELACKSGGANLNPVIATDPKTGIMTISSTGTTGTAPLSPGGGSSSSGTSGSGSSSGSDSATSGGVFEWIKNNPLLAAAAVVGLVLLIEGGK